MDAIGAHRVVGATCYPFAQIHMGCTSPDLMSQNRAGAAVVESLRRSRSLGDCLIWSIPDHYGSARGRPGMCMSFIRLLRVSQKRPPNPWTPMSPYLHAARLAGMKVFLCDAGEFKASFSWGWTCEVGTRLSTICGTSESRDDFKYYRISVGLTECSKRGIAQTVKLLPMQSKQHMELEMQSSPVQELAIAMPAHRSSKDTALGCSERTAALPEAFDHKLLVEEVKALFRFAWPVVASQLCHKFLPIACLIFVGSMSEEALAATGLSLMLQNITGTSICRGLASGLETFASQLNGAGEYRLVAVAYQRAIVILTVASLPTAIAWWFAAELLMVCGIESGLTTEIVAPFMRIMILTLPGMVFHECTKRYLLAQGITRPMLHVSIVVNAIHLASLWLLVKMDLLGLGVLGASVSMVISYTANAGLLLLYVWWFGLHKATWCGWTLECLHGGWDYLQVALPGMGMLCLEWWGFEIITFASGRLGTSALAAQTVLFHTVAIFFMLPLGIGIAASTLVGNALGAGDTAAAKRTTGVSILASVCITVCFSMALYCQDEAWTRVFTNQDEVVALVVSVIPIQACFFASDSAAGVSSGILRGAGRQTVGVACNCLAFYVVAIPLGLYLSFNLGMELGGLWWGLLVGSLCQCGSMMTYLSCVSWTDLAKAAAGRVANQNMQSSAFQEKAGKAEQDDHVLLENAV